MSAVKRLLTLLRLFWTTSLAAEMEYRANFTVAALASAGNLAGGLFALSLLYRPGYAFAGWPWEASLMVVGVFTLLTGFAETFLVPNLGRIVTYVQEGTLDFVLLKPVDSQFYVSARSVSPWGVPDLLLGLGLVVWAATRLDLGVLALLRAAPLLALALLSLYSLWFILGAMSIWFVKIYNVTEVLRGLLAAGRFPIAAYPAGYRFFFTFVIPVAFLTTVPVEAARGHLDASWLAAAAAIALVLAVAARLFWRFALRFYTSASS